MKPIGALMSASALFGAVALAVPAQAQFRPTTGQDTYIVQMKAAPAAEFVGTRPTPGAKLNVADKAVSDYLAQLKADHDEAAAAVGAQKIYDYGITVNGFAAKLSEGQIAALRSRNDVVNVFPFKTYNLDTNNTPEFLGLNQRRGPWRRRVTGNDVVIAVLDGGIWPEHPCFEDRPTRIRGDRGRKVPYGHPPETFTGANGPDSCQFGDTAFNPEDAPFHCNNKLLSARFYVDGFLDPEAENQGLSPGECLSARDCGPFGDHGTNVAGTAACNAETPAQENGVDAGEISGTAPRARIAHYKVCWSVPTAPTGTCANVDLIAAVEQAIADGVDVMNLSLGSDNPTLGDPFDLALLNATNAGIYVATSAGNNGSAPETVGSPASAPWVTAVAAMQDPGVSAIGLQVEAPDSIASFYIALEGAGPVTLADSGDINADLAVAEPLNACGADADGNPTGIDNDLTGKIALVIRGGCGFNEKYLNAQSAGAVAIVVYNDGTDPFRIDPIVMGGLTGPITIPGVMIGFNDGDLIQNTLAGGESVAGLLSPDVSEPRGDRMAGFSSRGPNGFTNNLFKPDVAAPGVQILSAGSPLGGIDTRDELFSSISGTSFSSPHVAGLFALLKQAHPDWSPAAVRSAYMTTGRQNILETFQDEAADPFDIGAGMVVPKDALDPGLVYEADAEDYAAYACGQGIFGGEFDCAALAAAGKSFAPEDLNYPAVALGEVLGSQTVTRTVTAVEDFKRLRPRWWLKWLFGWGGGDDDDDDDDRKRGRKVKYRAHIEAPEGFEIRVHPHVLRLREGESKSFQVEVKVTDATPGEWRFGAITWRDGRGHEVRSPIAARARAFEVPVEQTQTGPEGSGSFDFTFGYTGDYTPQVHGLNDPILFSTINVDDPDDTFDFLVTGENAFFGALGGGTAFARWSTDDPYTSGDDNVDLYLYFCEAFSCGLIDSSTGPGSKESVEVAFPQTNTDIAGGTGYLVITHAVDTQDALPAGVAVFFQAFGIDNVVGNFSIDDAPASAVSGATGTIDYSWSGLSTGAGSRQLGAVSFSTPDGSIQGLTLINVTNDEGGSLCDLNIEALASFCP